MNLFVDYETWSSVNLISRGSDVYMDAAKPLIAVWAFDDEPVQLCDFTLTFRGAQCIMAPGEFLDALSNPRIRKIAHNAFFDRMVTERLLGVKSPVEQWHCTQAQAQSHSLPGGLGPLCEVLGIPAESAKQADGKRLIRKFCCGKEFPVIDQNDPDWKAFEQYAIHDILATREAFTRMPNWNYIGHEKRVWNLDQKINNKGLLVDVTLATNAVDALKIEKTRLNQETFQLTDQTVGAATQRDKLLQYLCEVQGVILKDLRASTIEAALEDETLHEGTKQLLRVRLQSAKASPSKYLKVLKCVGQGNRLRGTLNYAGANRTQRWAGRMFQPQNLLRPTMKKQDIRHCVELLRDNNPEGVTIFSTINEACANATRGIIVAPEGMTLQGADYSAIEGRGNAWISGEDWKLAAFRDPKIDMYCTIFEKAFGLAAGTVGKKDPRRQIGKVMELALGYEGGVGAFLNMAAVYDMDLAELGRTVQVTEEAQRNYEYALEQKRNTYKLPPEIWLACETLKLGYRKGNPAIAGMWKKVKSAAIEAIVCPGTKVQVGRLVFDCNGHWLRIKLPSGRFLSYCLPQVHGDGKITYMGWKNRAWVRIGTYGGKLIENIVQALSRDILAAAMVRLDDAGYNLVLHVHDEAMAEVAGRSLDEFIKLMVTPEPWMDGFPIAAEGFELRRYEKA